MSVNVNLADGMQPGQTYTFKFKPTGINFTVTGIDITADLQSVDYLSNVSAQGSAGFIDVYIQFTYDGDGTDSVDYVASDIINAVATKHFSYNLEFQNGILGIQTQAGGAIAGLNSGALGAIPNLVPSTTTIVLIVVGLALVVFLVSGGAAATREAIA